MDKKNNSNLSENLSDSLKKEWNYIKNDGLNPEDFSCSSSKIIWWRCQKGHEWQATIANRAKNGSGCPYCSGLKAIVGENDLKTIRPDLVKEWNYKKNTNGPENYKAQSNKRVWWKCKNGHEWQATIYSRSQGTSCPYCSGNKAIIGENDLETKYPEIAKEWNLEKNSPLIPSLFLPMSNKKVWWKCKNGHEWQAVIANRIKGIGCPYCSGRLAISGETDLVTVYPWILRYWDDEKNNVDPRTLTSKTEKEIWWKCEKGHSWKNKVSNQQRNKGCPYCNNKRLLVGYNDLKSLYPNLAKEWDKEKNGILQPTEVLPRTNKTVWWKCEKGHSWKARIVHRVDNVGCPYCSGRLVIPGENDLKTEFPRIAEEWHPTKNGMLKPENVKSGTARKVWWKCKNGHEWKTLISDRTRNGSSCPYCNESKGEKAIEEALVVMKCTYRAQNTFHDRKYKALLRDDFAILDSSNNVVGTIEYNGEQHYGPIDFNGKGKKKALELYELIRIRDQVKTAYLEQHNIKQLIIPFWDFDNIPTLVTQFVSEVLNVPVTKKNINHQESKRTKRENNYPEVLLKFWDYDKNGPVPEKKKNTNQEYWWKCKNGHEWQATIIHFLKKKNCPFCARDKQRKGCFADLSPSLLSEWDYDKNMEISPEDISPKSGKKVWWIDRFGHSWEATVINRVNGTGCPYCAGRKVLKGFNDLKTLNPEIAEEWDYSRNGGLEPDQVTVGSIKRVFWRCKNNHFWSATIHSRTRGNGTGCPYCSGNKVWAGYNDLYTTNPELIEEWDQENNGQITPDAISMGSTISVWWKCKECGYQWRAKVLNRTINKSGCPLCQKRNNKNG